MKKSLVLAMAMALGVTASAYAANPFSDVPAGHWAYDSVNNWLQLVSLTVMARHFWWRSPDDPLRNGSNRSKSNGKRR